MSGWRGMHPPQCGEPCISEQSFERSSGGRRSFGGVEAVALFPPIHVSNATKAGPRAPPRNKMALYESVTSGKRPHSLMGPPSSTLSGGGGASGRQYADGPQTSGFLPSGMSYESKLPYFPYSLQQQQQQQQPYTGNGRIAMPVPWFLPPLYDLKHQNPQSTVSSSGSMRGPSEQHHQRMTAAGAASAAVAPRGETPPRSNSSGRGNKKKARRNGAAAAAAAVSSQEAPPGQDTGVPTAPVQDGREGGCGAGPLANAHDLKRLPPRQEQGRSSHESDVLAFRAWRQQQQQLRQQQQQPQHWVEPKSSGGASSSRAPAAQAEGANGVDIRRSLVGDMAAAASNGSRLRTGVLALLPGEGTAHSGGGGSAGAKAGARAGAEKLAGKSMGGSGALVGQAEESAAASASVGGGSGADEDEGALSEQLPAGGERDKEEDECDDVDSVRHPIVTALDVVAVVGQLEFWKSRKAILRQQRIFSTQVFELHRLLRVQQELMHAHSLPPPESCKQAGAASVPEGGPLPHQNLATPPESPPYLHAHAHSHSSGDPSAAAAAAAAMNAFTAEALAMAAHRVGEEASRLMAQKEQLLVSAAGEGGASRMALPSWGGSGPCTGGGGSMGGFCPTPQAAASASAATVVPWFAPPPPAAYFPSLAAAGYLPYCQVASFQPSTSHQGSAGGFYSGLYSKQSLEAAVPTAISLGISSMEAGSAAEGGRRGRQELYPAYGDPAWGQPQPSGDGLSFRPLSLAPQQEPRSLATCGAPGVRLPKDGKQRSSARCEAAPVVAIRGGMKVVQARSPFVGRAFEDGANIDGSGGGGSGGGALYTTFESSRGCGPGGVEVGGDGGGGIRRRREQLQMQQLPQQHDWWQQQEEDEAGPAQDGGEGEDEDELGQFSLYTPFRGSGAAAAARGRLESTGAESFAEASRLTTSGAEVCDARGGAATAVRASADGGVDERDEEGGGATAELPLFPTTATLAHDDEAGQEAARAAVDCILETRGSSAGVIKAVVPRPLAATPQSTAKLLRVIEQQRRI